MPDQLVDNHRVGAAGEHGQVGQPAAVVGGPHLPRHPVDGAGDPGRPFLAHVGQAEPARGDVGRGRGPAVHAAHPRDAGRGQERRDAGADPARAVDPGERGPAAGQHRRPAVAVPVGERGAGQLRGDPLEQVPGQRRPQAGREVIEHPGRGQQAENLVHRVLADAVRRRRPRHLGRIAGPVEQRHDRGRLAQPGQRPGPPGVDPDLQRVAVPPERPKSRLQCWSHATNRDGEDRHSGRNGTLLRGWWLSATPATSPIGVAGVADRCVPGRWRRRQDRPPVTYASDSGYRCRWRSQHETAGSVVLPVEAPRGAVPLGLCRGSSDAGCRECEPGAGRSHRQKGADRYGQFAIGAGCRPRGDGHLGAGDRVRGAAAGDGGPGGGRVPNDEESVRRLIGRLGDGGCWRSATRPGRRATSCTGSSPRWGWRAR